MAKGGTAEADGHELVRRPWAVALAIAVPLAIAYVTVAPSAADLAAATYRSDLFARVGLTAWDTGWYAAHGHWLLGYSLLSPALGALLGVHALLALSAVTGSVSFALLAQRAFDRAGALASTVVFAVGLCIGMLSGRVPYYLGFAIALTSLLALTRGRLAVSLGLAVLASVASPVAGSFLALAGLAVALASPLLPERRGADPPSSEGSPSGSCIERRGLALTLAALLPIATLSLAYPEGGFEPFAPSAFWPALAGVLAVAALLPRGGLSAGAHRALRTGAGLYALALIGAFAIHTPLGGNAARLGPALAAPLLSGVLWRERRRVLFALAPLLLYWQLVTPIRDIASIAGDPSTHASYYAPLLGELHRLENGAPTIVEVPLTAAHWEAAYLAGHDGVSLARGWERQLDTRYAAVFYGRTLTSAAYRRWLEENRVEYVALPDAELDGAGRLEGELIASGVPYLRELWHSRHWRLYRLIV